MTDVPVTTVWDVLASALDDPWFLIISTSLILGTACLVRYFRKRSMGGWNRCRCPP